mgnify:CR=1 FL=1
MANMKFYCDAERCIECNACVTACKNEHEVPWGVNRRRVVTLDDGVPGEKSVSVACMHCTDAPCAGTTPPRACRLRLAAKLTRTVTGAVPAAGIEKSPFWSVVVEATTR